MANDCPISFFFDSSLPQKTSKQYHRALSNNEQYMAVKNFILAERVRQVKPEEIETSYFLSILASLGENQVRELEKHIRLSLEKMELEKNNTEKNVFSPKDTARRNLEYFQLLLRRDKIESTIHKMQETEDLSSRQNILNDFYQFITSQSSHNRGNYDSQHLIKIARIIQVHFKDILAQASGELILYGSLPMGRAKPKESDIDVFLGLSMQKAYVENLGSEPIVRFNMLPPWQYFKPSIFRLFTKKGRQFYYLFKTAEDNLRKEIKHTNKTEGDLLSLNVPYHFSEKDFFDLMKFSPIALSIRENQIFLIYLNPANKLSEILISSESL